MKAQPTSPGAAAVPDGEFLSAWLDGEVEPESGHGIAQGLSSNAAWRRRIEDWTWVGDALRSEEVAALHSPQLCTRIVRALESEPALLAPQALAAPVAEGKPTPSRWGHRAASAGAIAAAAAVLVFVAVPMLRDGGSGLPGSGVRSAAPTVALAPAPVVAAAAPIRKPDTAQAVAMGGSGVGLAVGGTAVQAMRPASFDAGWGPYIDAHSDYAGYGVMPAADVILRPDEAVAR